MQVQWPNNDSVLDWMSAMVNFSERVDMLTRVEYVSHAAHCLHSNGHTDLGMEYLFGLMEKLGQEPAELRFQLLEEVAWTFIYGGRKEHVGKVFDKMASVADSDPELAERLAALRDAVAESGSETTDEDDFTSPVDELESMTADELHGAILHELQELLAAKDDPYSNVHHWPILFGAYLRTLGKSEESDASLRYLEQAVNSVESLPDSLGWQRASVLVELAKLAHEVEIPEGVVDRLVAQAHEALALATTQGLGASGQDESGQDDDTAIRTGVLKLVREELFELESRRDVEQAIEVARQTEDDKQRRDRLIKLYARCKRWQDVHQVLAQADSDLEVLELCWSVRFEISEY